MKYHRFLLHIYIQGDALHQRIKADKRNGVETKRCPICPPDPDQHQARIEMTPDKKFLFISNRGVGAIIGFNVDKKSGDLTLLSVSVKKFCSPFIQYLILLLLLKILGFFCSKPSCQAIGPDILGLIRPENGCMLCKRKHSSWKFMKSQWRMVNYIFLSQFHLTTGQCLWTFCKTPQQPPKQIRNHQDEKGRFLQPYPSIVRVEG